MNKFALIVAASTVFATSAYASQRGYDLRDTQYYTTSGVAVETSGAANADSNAFAVADSAQAESAFQRTARISTENDQGRH